MAVVDFLNRQAGGDAGVEEVGIGGFRLLARTRQTTTLTSQAPTSYLEDGSSASDHLVLDPLTISIDGSVADVFVEPQAATAELRRLQSTVGTFAGYLPGRTQAQLQRINSLATQVMDRARQIDRIVEDGKQVLSFLGDQRDTESVSLRERFIDSMEALHYGKQLISIDMPYRRLDSMRITSFSYSVDNQREAITFSIRAQKVRITDTQYVQLEQQTTRNTGTNAPVAAGANGEAADGLGGQTQPEIDKGVQEGEERPRSMLSSIFGD